MTNTEFLSRGVYYVANPNSLGKHTPAAREALASSTTVDARFANGGLTSTGGHPVQIFESGPETHAMDGNAYFAIDTAKQLEERWPQILAGKPDFLKIYLERSEFHAQRRENPAYFGKRGLDPALVGPVVERAHAAGLRVAVWQLARNTSRSLFSRCTSASASWRANMAARSASRTSATRFS